MGYCESVISDMQAHPFNARVQERGCGVLATLAVKSNNQVTIAAAGGIEAALSAMRAHLSNAGVQENGCRALWNLADNSNNQVTIADAGGIEAVIYAMQAHPSDAGVQGHGCWTLRNLTANSNNQVTIVAAGGIVAVTSAIPLFLFLPTYRRMASETLSILAADTNGQVAIAAAPNADVQQCGSLLGNLAVERGEFFHLLLAANTDSATAATYATYALLEKLRPEVSNCQELILFYTIANASFKKEQITLGQRNDFLESVLEAVPKMFQFDEESRVVAMLKLVLDKAVEDAIIDKNTRYRFGESYTKENVLADYRFLSLTQTVQQHGARLDRVEAVLKSIDSRQKYLDNRQKGQAIVRAVCSFLPIFGGIFAESLGLGCVGLDSLGLGAAAINSIVDFSDTAHIQELIVDQIGIKENDKVIALANESTMTDLYNRLTNTSDQDLLPLIGILKVSQNLSEPDSNELHPSPIRPHEASLPKPPVEYRLETLKAMGVLQLKRTMEDAGVFFDPKDVVEKLDMLTIFRKSRRLVLIFEPAEQEEEIMMEDSLIRPQEASLPVSIGSLNVSQNLSEPDSSEPDSSPIRPHEASSPVSIGMLEVSQNLSEPDSSPIRPHEASSPVSIGSLKVSQNLSEPDLSEPDSSPIRSHEASSPVSIGSLKVSQNLSEPDLSEPDSSPIRPHEASLPLSDVLAKIRLSHHADSLLENGIEMADDLKDLSIKQAQEIGVTKVGELNRLKKWQKSF